MDPSYTNYLTGASPEYIAMQANYLRMLANYYNNNAANESRLDSRPESDHEENMLERSLRAESVFLQNDIHDFEIMPSTTKAEVISVSPPRSRKFSTEIDQHDSAENFYAQKYPKNAIYIDEYPDILVENSSKSKNSSFSSKKNQEFFSTPTNSRAQNNYSDEADERPIKSSKITFDQMIERELKKNGPKNSYSTNDSLPPRVKKNNSNLDEMNKTAEIFEVKNKRNIEKSSEIISKPSYAKPKRPPAETSKKPKKISENSYKKTEATEIISPETVEITEPIYSLDPIDLLDPILDSADPDPTESKPNFLKRGGGKLCTNQKSKETPAFPVKTLNSEKSLTNISSLYKDDQQDKNLFLEEQIKYYQSENQKLQKLVKEVEEKKKRLDKDKHDFFKEKEKFMDEFEKTKSDEMQKLKKERAALEKKLKTQSKEKEEIQVLKARIEELQQTIEENKKDYNDELEKLHKEIEDLKYNKNSKDLEISEDCHESRETPEYRRSEYSESENESEKSEDFEVAEIESRPKAGKQEIIYNNGIKKEIYPDGYTVVYFNNKDVKQCFADGRIVYHYAETNTTQTTYPDGLQLFKFPNGQIEKHFPDGSKEISFQDGTVKCIFADGQEESVFPDGTVQTVDSKGVKYIEFTNGQKDTIYPNGVKIRKFPDGRVKKIMPDGKVIESN